jgi:putative heme iron utilization protein
VATDDAGAPLLLISTLAEHTRNIAGDARVSLLLDGTGGLDEPLTGPRASLQGRAEVAADARARSRYLARYPSAAGYAGFGDFRFYRLVPERAHLVAGFGRIAWIEGPELLLAPAHATAIGAIEQAVIEHMNRDHADALGQIAEHLLGAPGEGAVMAGFDAEGCDIRVGAHLHRLPFDTPVTDADSARSTLAALARKTRSAAVES